MDRRQISAFLESFERNRGRVVVVVDYGNVEKWKHSMGWKVGIKELGQLVKQFANGNDSKRRRRFYYGSDFGADSRSNKLNEWSRSKLEMAQWNNFTVVSKRVKYIRSTDSVMGFEKKCDLDVEMAVDLIRLRDSYDHMVLFSGDGDLVYAVRYLNDEFGKKCSIFGARNHIGAEVFDAQRDGVVSDILFAEDFEYRIRDRYGR